MAVFDFVEGFYNPHRRHSSLENHSPVSYERRYDQASAVVETDQAMENRCAIPTASWKPLRGSHSSHNAYCHELKDSNETVH